MYEYTADVLKVLDGDTIEVSIRLGLGVCYQTPLRMLGINAPEIHSTNPAEKTAGERARDFLAAKIVGKTVVLKTAKPDPKDKYGRYLATVFTVDRTTLGENVNDAMVAAGHAKAYDGGKRVPWEP